MENVQINLCPFRLFQYFLLPPEPLPHCLPSQSAARIHPTLLNRRKGRTKAILVISFKRMIYKTPLIHATDADAEGGTATKL